MEPSWKHKLDYAIASVMITAWTFVLLWKISSPLQIGHSSAVIINRCALCALVPAVTPVLFVTPWTVVKIQYENSGWVFGWELDIHNMMCLYVAWMLMTKGWLCFPVCLDAGVSIRTDGSGGLSRARLHLLYWWVNVVRRFLQRFCGLSNGWPKYRWVTSSMGITDEGEKLLSWLAVTRKSS